MTPVCFTVPPAQAGMPLGAFLRAQGISLRVVRSLKYREGGLVVNGVCARTSRPLAAGDVVELHWGGEEGVSALPQAIPLDIRYRSADALVVNKPPGMAAHPAPGNRTGTLANAVCGLLLRGGRGAVFRPIGRLDKNTSGLALCAAHPAAAHLLGRTAQKTYVALATGRMAEGLGAIEAPLAPRPGSAVAQQVRPGGKPSRTEYTVLAACARASLVRVCPASGRTHQIRAHFAHLGHPLAGDALYGGDTALLPRHALHCAELAFEELGGNRPHLHCHLPWDMQAAVEALGLGGQLAETR